MRLDRVGLFYVYFQMKPPAVFRLPLQQVVMFPTFTPVTRAAALVLSKLATKTPAFVY
jgi:hypothetical protein